MQLLYQRDFTKQSPKDTLPLFHVHFGKPQGSDDFASALVQGVEEHREEIDRLISKHTENWTLERMSRVDHNILRVAVFELLWCQDIPPKVSINEAIELGKKFSTEKSAMFINGVLDQILQSEQR